MTTLSQPARRILTDLAAGTNRIFANYDRLNGWAQIEHLGLATRDGDYAHLTDAGRAAIKEQRV